MPSVCALLLLLLLLLYIIIIVIIIIIIIVIIITQHAKLNISTHHHSIPLISSDPTPSIKPQILISIIETIDGPPQTRNYRMTFERTFSSGVFVTPRFIC